MTSTKLNMMELEAAAKLAASNHIINMLQRPGQLEKIDQYKRRLTRKKASVEAQLKSAMQSQLDGVRQGLNQLHTSLQDIKEVENSLKTMSASFADVPSLCNTLNEVREENMRHSQYVTAKENLKHIFTVPDSVEKTKQWINDGKLLHAHQSLRDLENARDDLLFELHKLPNQSTHDKGMLKAYFADVQMLSNLLEKQLRLVVSRTLNTVRKEPTVIVTALRIIEQEEKSDEDALKHERQTGFLALGRPKRWKKMAFEVLEKAVATRIEGTQVDERKDNKLWLVRYLELIRLLILEDLRVVKTLCVPCFPPRYNIINEYVRMYHTCLARRLEEIIQNGLEGNEYVSILAWTLNTYQAEDLMGHPDLKSHTENLGPLLPKAVLDTLQDEYLGNMEKNYTEWMQNTLKTEKQEWRSNKQPQMDSYLRTAAPVIIFQMIDQNLQVTKTISPGLTERALNLSVEQVIKYGNLYRDGIVEFKNKHFEDRSQVPFFTNYMITILNNCLRLVELGSELENQFWNPNMPHVLQENFRKLKNTYLELRDESADYLLEEVSLDLDRHFEELFTSRWLMTTLPIDTICATLEDYFQDYGRLVEENYKCVIQKARRLITKRYVTSMLSKRITFKTYEECQTAAARIKKEAGQLKQAFLASNADEEDDDLDIALMFGEILKCEDDMLSFDLHRIVEKYPDISEEHLLRLLYLRGDLPRSDLKEKVTYVLKSSKPNVLSQNGIFREITFPKLVNLGF